MILLWLIWISMLILVSNDDGIDSEGIHVLAKSLRKIKESRVVIVAPDREKSATSHSLTLHRPLRVTQIKDDCYSVDGTPTDAVTLAVHKILRRRPDLLISGINRGANLGEDVHYSGTVSAALEGAIMGVPALAVSVVGRSPFLFGPAVSFAVKLSRKVLDEGIPSGLVLNVNVPNKPASKIRGHEFTVLGKHNYSDVIVEKMDPSGRPYFWIGGDPRQFENNPGSDCNAYLKNRISITPLHVDLTDFAFLEKMRRWKIQ